MKNLFLFVSLIFLIACNKKNIDVEPVEPEEQLIVIDTLLDFTVDDEVNNCDEFSLLLLDKQLEYIHTGVLFPNHDGVAIFADNQITNVEGNLFSDSYSNITIVSNDTIFRFCNVVELLTLNQETQTLTKDTLTFARMTTDASGTFSVDTTINFILFREF